MNRIEKSGRFQRIRSQLVKKSLMENLRFFAQCTKQIPVQSQ